MRCALFLPLLAWTLLGASAIAADENGNGLRHDIVLWLAAIGPRGPASPPAGDIARLLHDHPNWPERNNLAFHLGLAMQEMPSGPALLTLCHNNEPLEPPALPGCAGAEQAAGHKAEAQALARRAYVEAGPGQADMPDLLKNFGDAIGPAQFWDRFERLAWMNAASAATLIPHLHGEAQTAAQAWLLLHHDDAKADDMLAQLPAASPYRDLPLLRLEQARAARREGALRSAAEFWAGPTTLAETAVAPPKRQPFFVERDILARELLAEGDFVHADAVATDPLNTTPGAAEFEALRGLIAWDGGKLTDAAKHFATMAQIAPAVVIQAHALWWQGVVAQRSGQADAAHRFFTQAAAYPTNFYGQAAILALGQGDHLATTLTTSHDPTISAASVKQFAGNELAHIAEILAGLDENHHASLFLERAALDAGTAEGFAYFAERARHLGLPEAAVQISRFAGRIGVILPQTGFPAPYNPPPGTISSALALGIMRQESSFNPMSHSPAGAEGVMQLLPSTASDIAGKLHVKFNPNMLSDPISNMALGCAYLGLLVQKFDNVLPYAIAAYDTGPRRVREWLQSTITPPDDLTSMIIWIDHIPIEETRGYVTHVLESTTIYDKGTFPNLGLSDKAAAK